LGVDDGGVCVVVVVISGGGGGGLLLEESFGEGYGRCGDGFAVGNVGADDGGVG